MIQEMIHARIIDWGINAFSKLGYQTSRNIEYNFAIENIPHLGNIMDVGSTGSLFSLKMARKGHRVFANDIRPYQEKHANLVNITEDIKNINLPEKSLDVITCISVIEHIGLSAYGDPQYEDGEFQAMQIFKKLLKKDGILILTTPFAGKFAILPHEKTFERIYDWNRLQNLFLGWNILKEEFFIPLNSKNWIKASRKESELVYLSYKRSNLSCFVLSGGD